MDGTSAAASTVGVRCIAPLPSGQGSASLSLSFGVRLSSRPSQDAHHCTDFTGTSWDGRDFPNFAEMAMGSKAHVHLYEGPLGLWTGFDPRCS